MKIHSPHDGSLLAFAAACFCLGLAGCGSTSESVSMSKNDLAKQVEGTWIGQHNFGTRPNGTSDSLFQEFVFKFVPSNYQHGTWTYRSSSDGKEWKTVGEGAWTLLPSMQGDADNYTSKSNGKFDVRVDRYMTTEGAEADLFNNSKNRLWLDFDGASFVDTGERSEGLKINFKKK
jgi:hypothetical protein